MLVCSNCLSKEMTCRCDRLRYPLISIETALGYIQNKICSKGQGLYIMDFTEDNINIEYCGRNINSIKPLPEGYEINKNNLDWINCEDTKLDSVFITKVVHNPHDELLVLNEWANRLKPLHTSRAICTECWSHASECDCSNMVNIVFVDEGMDEIIMRLNRKGYPTDFCCIGHRPGDQIYILFSKIIDETLFEPLQHLSLKQFEVSIFNDYRTSMESFYEQNTSRDEFIAERKRYTDVILEWVKGLPVVEGSMNDGIEI